MGFVEAAFMRVKPKSLMDKLVREEVFSEVDRHFALGFAGSEEKSLFCCFLMAACRHGHLCVRVEKGAVFPDLDILNVEDIALQNELKEKIFAGAAETKETEGVIWDQSRCYLPKNWHYETQIIESLRSLSDPKDCLDQKSFQNLLDRDQTLLPKQKAAISQVGASCFVLLCGAPGTGKTYTASRMIRILVASLIEGEKWKVALAAPTGKAALHLKSKLQCSLDGALIESGTIHSLFSTGTEAFYDLVLVDEASMIDVQRMVDILRHMKKGARLCLMGDPDQLPPVEAGSLFQDLTEVEHLKKVVLDQAMRFESRNLLDFAIALKDNDVPSLSSLMQQKIKHWDCDPEEYSAREKILDYAEGFYPLPCREYPDPASALKRLSRFRILCALRRGRAGADQLNEKLLERTFLKGGREDWFSVPVLITQNDPKQDLYNGQAAVLITKGKNLQGKVFIEDGRVFSSHQLPRYQYGYCLSVHKSQGSEFMKVLLILPRSSIGFGRELLYTAVTRAKKELEIMGKIDTLKKISDRQTRRESGIRVRLASG